MNKPICIFLIGAPLSGKSTFRRKMLEVLPYVVAINRDEIRVKHFPQPYKITDVNERRVSLIANDEILIARDSRKWIVIDNTNCKMRYIRAIKKLLGDEYRYDYFFFDKPLIVLYWRNIKRLLTEKRWIPLSVIRKMKENYKIVKKIIEDEKR